MSILAFMRGAVFLGCVAALGSATIPAACGRIGYTGVAGTSVPGVGADGGSDMAQGRDLAHLVEILRTRLAAERNHGGGFGHGSPLAPYCIATLHK